MIVVKLTRQYNGYYHFTHRIEFNHYGRDKDTRIRQWVQIRNWLWSQFGPSAEQALARAEYFGEQPKWAWDSDKSVIYLRDEAYTMFELKKEFWNNHENL